MELDYRAIGKRIKIARIKADLTQEALAEKASLSTTHMSNIETGNSKLSLPTIVSLANALSVSVDEFLCDSVIHSKDIFSQEIQDLVSDCDEYEIRMIADFVRAAKETIRKRARCRFSAPRPVLFLLMCVYLCCPLFCMALLFIL